jgi:hypothetical protein
VSDLWYTVSTCMRKSRENRYVPAMYVEAITTMNARKYGGADKPCEWIGEKPISLSMVGRNTGREEKETLHEKYINAVK